MCVCVCVTFCNPVYWGPPGSSVLGIFQARILQWVAFHFSGVSSQPRGQTLVSYTAGRFATVWATREASYYFWYHYKWNFFFFSNFWLCLVTVLGTFSCGMWDRVPWPGIEPRPPARGNRVWATQPPAVLELLSRCYFWVVAVSVWRLCWFVYIRLLSYNLDELVLARVAFFFCGYLPVFLRLFSVAARGSSLQQAGFSVVGMWA